MILLDALLTGAQVDKLINYIPMIAILVGATISMWKWLNGRVQIERARAENNSVGVAAILELTKCDQKMQNSIEDLEHTDKEHALEISNLKDNYKMFSQLAYDALKKGV